MMPDTTPVAASTPPPASSPSPSAVARLRALSHGVRSRLADDRLFRNSVAIMATTVLTSGLGYVIWLTVARVAGSDVSGDGAR